MAITYTLLKREGEWGIRVEGQRIKAGDTLMFIK